MDTIDASARVIVDREEIFARLHLDRLRAMSSTIASVRFYAAHVPPVFNLH